MSVNILANKSVANNLGLATLEDIPYPLVTSKVVVPPASWVAGGAAPNNYWHSYPIKNVSNKLTTNSTVLATSLGAISSQAALNWLITAVPSAADGGTITLYISSDGATAPTGNLTFSYYITKF